MKRSQRIKNNSEMGVRNQCTEDMVGIGLYQEAAMKPMTEKARIDLEIERCKWLDEEVDDE